MSRVGAVEHALNTLLDTRTLTSTTIKGLAEAAVAAVETHDTTTDQRLIPTGVLERVVRYARAYEPPTVFSARLRSAAVMDAEAYLPRSCCNHENGWHR